MELVLNISLLSLLLITAVAIVRVRDLFASVMLSGIYGLLSASFFVVMDAVDVAFTEAAVGAGVFPILLLAVLAMVGRYEQVDHRRQIAALVLVAITGAFLINGTLDLPAYGAADAPAHQAVSLRYIIESPQEIGIPNMVTSVLASYRGFDTLGEVVVIFTAAIGVMVLLATANSAEVQKPRRKASMAEHRILRIVSKMLMPLILLFALYVQFHGEYGPGGGFQAGVIFAAGIILYAMLFGVSTARTVIKPHALQMLAALGVLVYGSVGLLSLVSGANFLDYSALANDPVHGQHLGILLIELGVGITVAAAMILIFYAFSETPGNGEAS
jgi:multicomponent Na+:H+ antiporter subunit B